MLWVRAVQCGIGAMLYTEAEPCSNKLTAPTPIPTPKKQASKQASTLLGAQRTVNVLQLLRRELRPLRQYGAQARLHAAPRHLLCRGQAVVVAVQGGGSCQRGQYLGALLGGWVWGEVG